MEAVIQRGTPPKGKQRRGDTGIEGLESGQRAHGVESAGAGANRYQRGAASRTDLRRIQRGVEEAGRERRPREGSVAAVIMGERKTASRCRRRTGETARDVRQSRPAAFKRGSGEHSEVNRRLFRTAALEAKRAGWE
jgi:hypothetical protein